MSKKEDVERFLLEWKSAAYRFVYFIERDKNLSTFMELGITENNAREILMNLTVEDYISGPLIDHSRKTDELWEFGTSIQNRDIYIKIKLFPCGIANNAKCVSFHSAEKPLKYFFTEKNNS